uniref:Small ribosomal subunit protein bS21 n=1 Tax=candidate division WOR-3 bacterium TaxID=2052148 RepID=A0A7C3J6Q3_UNCW3
MPGVKVREGESFDGALKRFKRLCEKAGILSEIKKHQFYEKPSEIKKREKIQAVRKSYRSNMMKD